MSVKAEFIDAAKQGKVLLRRCVKCDTLLESTAYFCDCGSSDFVNATMSGTGVVATYTIITVPPAGFEKYTPYAFVVFKLDDADARMSGFMADIASPADLPVGSPVHVVGYDERGVVVAKS